MRINIDKIEVGERIRKEVARIDELAADIAKNGLLNPVTVMAVSGKGSNGEGYQLLAGLRRLMAAQSLGWTDIFVNVVTPTDAEQALRMEIAENEEREPFTVSERIHFGALIEEIEKAKARERQLSGKKVTDLGLNRAQGQENTGGEMTRGRTNDIVAPKVGMSRAIYQRAKYVVKNAPSEVVEQVDSGKKSVSTAYKEMRVNEREEKAKNVPLRDNHAAAAAHAVPSKTDDAAVEVVVFDTPVSENVEEDNDDEAAEYSEDDGDDVSSSDACSYEIEPVQTASDIQPIAEPVNSVTGAESSGKKAECPKPEKAKKTPAQKRAEREMAVLSPRDRAAVMQRREYEAMSDKEKVADLEKRLADERFRADTAESELARTKELLHNAVIHRDATIDNQRGQIEKLTAELDEVGAERDELKDKVAELEKAVDNSVVNDSNNTTIHF